MSSVLSRPLVDGWCSRDPEFMCEHTQSHEGEKLGGNNAICQTLGHALSVENSDGTDYQRVTLTFRLRPPFSEMRVSSILKRLAIWVLGPWRSAAATANMLLARHLSLKRVTLKAEVGRITSGAFRNYWIDRCSTTPG